MSLVPSLPPPSLNAGISGRDSLFIRAPQCSVQKNRLLHSALLPLTVCYGRVLVRLFPKCQDIARIHNLRNRADGLFERTSPTACSDLSRLRAATWSFHVVTHRSFQAPHYNTHHGTTSGNVTLGTSLCSTLQWHRWHQTFRPNWKPAWWRAGCTSARTASRTRSSAERCLKEAQAMQPGHRICQAHAVFRPPLIWNSPTCHWKCVISLQKSFWKAEP